MKLNAWAAYLIVFISSACSLILEIVAGRILAPYIGVSLYTWTSIIGVVLAGISLGNYAGGRIADRWSSPRTLGIILLGGGLASLLVLPLTLLAGDRELFRLDCGSAAVLGGLCTPQLTIITKIVLLTTAIFFLPSFILGMVTPVVIRLSLRSLATSGNTVGKIYALSTLGSIVGTFVTGFVLIATFGTRQIVLGVGIVLLLMAVAVGGFWRVRSPTNAALLLTAALLTALLFGVIDQTRALASGCTRETDYFCIKVYDQDHGGRTLRTLVLDHLIHSYSSLDDPTYLEYAYIKVYAELTEYLAQQRPDYRALFIGGGGYTLPRAMEVMYPRSTIEVIEIDPGVTETAYEWMGLPANSRVRTYNFDARLVLEALQDGGPRYDLVFGDAFNDLSVPYHLTTREFDAKVRAILRDDGIYMVNVIDKFQGGLFLPSFVRTLKTVFPHVYVMSAGTPWLASSSFPNTYVVVGTGTPIDLERLRRVRGQGPNGAPVTNVMPPDLMERWLASAPGVLLTDDYAPADNLVAPLFAERGL